MSFFSWFSAKSRQSRGDATGMAALAAIPSEKHASVRHPQAEPDASERKSRRHANREQLYKAIREAMTKAGVLSASYKFKVLSCDQFGKEFLVMVDLTHIAGDAVPLTAEMEALIVHSADVYHGILVSAVYWRFHEMSAARKAASASAAFPKPAVSRASHEPIQADEVAAFQQALLAASVQSPAVAVDKNVKPQRGSMAPRPQMDFEDTEIGSSVHVDKPARIPALSNTQYGDLV